MKLPKIITDTLKEDGKWSIKRLSGISGFYFGVLYIFMPFFVPSFPVHEFAFWGLMTFAGTAVGFTVWNKKINQVDNEEN